MIDKKTLLIFPSDPSLDFLNQLVEEISRLFQNIEVVIPSPGFMIPIDDDVEIIFFLGHGTNRQLFGSVDIHGKKTNFADVVNSARLFAETTILILACKSNEFLKNIQYYGSINGYVGFGDMPTDWGHIEDVRNDKEMYLIHFEEDHLLYYKNAIVECFISGIQNINQPAIPRLFFIGFRNQIDKLIVECLTKDWIPEIKKEMVELLYDLKDSLDYK